MHIKTVLSYDVGCRLSFSEKMAAHSYSGNVTLFSILVYETFSHKLSLTALISLKSRLLLVGSTALGVVLGFSALNYQRLQIHGPSCL